MEALAGSAFASFCASQCIPQDIYKRIVSQLILHDGKEYTPHRYFALNRFTWTAEDFVPKTIDGFDVVAVPFLEGFYQVNGMAKLKQCDLYQKHKIMGIDLTSGLAVKCLDAQPRDHVLDLCCAPGKTLLNILI